MKRRVLIIDDSESIRAKLSAALRGSYETLEAPNGAAALRLLTSERADVSLILLDTEMPVLDGFATLRLLRADPKLACIPVVVIMDNDVEDVETAALELGALDFVFSPYTPSIVLHRVTNVIKMRETSAFINTIERDTLTGLYNAKAFFQRASELFAANPETKYDVAGLDVERFKIINSLYGAKEGDRLLQKIAECIEDELYESGGLCARMGGDRFVWACERSADFIRQMAQNVQKQLADYPLGVTVIARFGVYHVEDISLPVMEMCDRAMLAVNSIKGRYAEQIAEYDDRLLLDILSQQEIANDMKPALESGQFRVFYQPKYNIANGAIAGAEALVRWQHPAKGIVPPDKFVPIFEKNGFITEMDFYVWEQVCIQIRRWLDAGNKPFPVSVNVSRVDIYNPNLVERLCALLAKYDLDSSLLHLEITETAYTENAQQLIDVVSELKKHGFIIEMDDFGTGYSSLNMISEVPVDTLKIDMRFLRSYNEKSRAGNILSFVVNLAKWMNLTVVAEGVETKEQMDFLRSLSCNYGQGYFFSKPLPLENFEQLVNSAVVDDNAASEKRSDDISMEELWNPSSAFNRIFGSFVGPLAIYEYEKERFSLLRGNTEYYSLMGAANGMAYASVRNLFEMIHPLDRGELESRLREAAEKRGGFTMELRRRSRMKSNDYVWFRLTLKSINSSTDKTIFFSSVYDVTAQKGVQSELETIIDCIPGGIVKSSADDGKMEYVSDTLLSMFGYTEESFAQKFQGRTDYLIYADDRRKTLESLGDQLENSNVARNEFRILNAAGEPRWVYDVTHVVCDENGVKRLYSIVLDNQNVHDEREAAEMEKQRYAALLSYTKDVVFEWNIERDAVVYSDTFKAKFGYTLSTRDASQNLKSSDVVHKDDLDRFCRMFRSVVEGDPSGTGDYRLRLESGDYRWFRLSILPLDDTTGRTVRIIGIVSDIDEQVSRLEKARRKAQTDPLTGLLNRNSFEQEVTRTLCTGTDECAMLMIDLDNFKSLNDSLGHMAGDDVLRETAKRISAIFRRTDFAARVGGDEFAVFMTDINDEQQLRRKLNDLMWSLTRPAHADGKEYAQKVCVGAVFIPKECDVTFRECYELADRVMYRAKNNGKNRWYIQNALEPEPEISPAPGVESR